jgi:hypothetical protein
MKALTVRQPWAWLIVHGHKPSEYRTWRTHYRGPLLIIASAALHPESVAAGFEFADAHGITLPGVIDTGGIVGTVILSDITGEPGDYQWHLTAPTPLPFIARKGGLGLLDIPAP